MKDYYCFEIEFPNVKLDSYYVMGNKVNDIHHAHLTATGNKIELKIFYDNDTYFGEKLSSWAQKLNWASFGSFIRISDEGQNERMKKLDLSDSGLLGMTIDSSYYEGSKKYLLVALDSAKFYWNAVKGETNTAEFHLPDSAFRVVQPFYSILFGWGEDFNIKRMQGMDSFYPLGKSQFRPEFNVISSDKISNRVATIKKEPKIQFEYKEDVTEAEAILYGDIVRCVASFYYHIRVDYSLRRIHLSDHTITIKKVIDERLSDDGIGLWHFTEHWDFDKFLKTNWQDHALQNYPLLSKVTRLFNQALLVDSSSEFLIRFNIIEICDTRRKVADKFQLRLKGNAKKKKYNEALDILLETIDPKDHQHFRNKWNTLSGKLDTRPMKSSLASFLESQNLKTEDFPISVNELKTLRDNITHGSISNVDSELLRKANTFLYRINGILILNMLGITEWELDTELE